MANTAVMNPMSISAMDDRSKVKTFVHTVDVDNGFVFQKGALSTDADKSQVYTISAPAASAGLTNLYMAYTAESNVTVGKDGNQYKIGDLNPQAFTNIAGQVFNGHRISVGDKIKVTAEALGGTQSTNTFVVATADTMKLTWAAAAVAGVTFKLEAESYFSIPQGTIGSQRVKAFILECVAVA